LTQDLDLFVALAEIAGVFVGFGALISVTRHGELDIDELGRIQIVVTIGLVVIVAALIPVTLDRYAINGESLWRSSSLMFLLLSWAAIIAPLKMREIRGLVVSQVREHPVMAAIFWLGLEVPIQAPLILAVFGAYPGLGPAFYTTALAINLIQAAFVLAQVVYARIK
jgi:hypothetical protein